MTGTTLNRIGQNAHHAMALGRFHAFRWLERWVPVAGLYALAWTLGSLRLARGHRENAQPEVIPLPDELLRGEAPDSPRHRRARRYCFRLLECIPDRLRERKWMDRCRIEGLDRLQAARQAGQPVILAFCHFGPFHLLRPWLRAAGVPAAVLVRGTTSARRALLRLKDRYTLFPEVPTVLHQDELRRASKCLAAGVPLLVAIDVPTGRQIRVPFSEGWQFQMPTGAIRLAIRHRAVLMPCTIVDDGGWRFRIHLDPPVPAELLTGVGDWTAAGGWLVARMRPHLRAHPAQCIPLLRRCFSPHPAFSPGSPP